jgi:aerobic-type carbon monoxide dehydrogenase small subunit (CoxS/CutS family)
MAEFVLNVNGVRVSAEAPPDEPLLYVLRNRLHLTGTKYGCGEGQCGACTVLLDGRATRSCLAPVAAVANAKIVTIEGLAQNGQLSAVQQAFLDEGAFQCGYCTSGMILSATALLGNKRSPNDDEIVTAMNGNLCRCGTYPRILAAIKRAVRQSTEGGSR